VDKDGIAQMDKEIERLKEEVGKAETILDNAEIMLNKAGNQRDKAKDTLAKIIGALMQMASYKNQCDNGFDKKKKKEENGNGSKK